MIRRLLGDRRGVGSGTPDLTGLQSFYRLDGNGNDSRGTKNAEIVNAITYQAGSSGQEAVFNGSSSYIKLPGYIDGEVTTSEVSFTGFLTCNSESTLSRFVTFNVNRFGIYVSVRTNENNGKLAVYVNSTTATILTTNSITLVQRNHIAVTIKKTGEVRIYINGSLIASTAMLVGTGGQITPAVNYLGANRNINYGLLAGKMEDWGFWDVELTAERVASIASYQMAGNDLLAT